MVDFSVWAPKAEKVDVLVNEKRYPMSPGQGGWWTVNLPQVSAGQDYAFSVDGSKPLPDPRSPWQPEGPEGPSRILDHGAFQWTDQSWQARPLGSAIIYELHVGTFTPTGTFDAVIDKLPYLVDLGITHIELMPVAEFEGHRGWGYDGVNLFAPHHAYGGPEGLKRLVNACHAHGLAVILDVVYNHLGPSGNCLPQFGPYFTEHHHTLWGAAVNFDDQDSVEVRDYFCSNALMWLRDYHFDGLRLDAIHAYADDSAIHFLEQVSRAVDDLETSLGRHLVLIAESDLNNPRVIQPYAAGGYGMDAQWSDDFHHALHRTITGEKDGYYADFNGLPDLVRALCHGFVYDGRYSVNRRRVHGRPGLGLDGRGLLGYIQNHDQIGNRAQGERISHLVGINLARVAAALVLTSPFVPMIFQGEEWGASTPFLYFTDYQDPELGRAVSQGRQREFTPFGWDPEEVPDPQDPETFGKSQLSWDEPDHEPHASIHEWYRQLIRLRRQIPDLAAGPLDRVSARADESGRGLIIHRGSVTILANFSDRPQTFDVPHDQAMDLLLSSSPETLFKNGRVQLAPESAAILRGK